MNGQEPVTTSDVVISFLLKKADEDELNDFDQLKIIKLVYFCHACTLGLHGKPLIENRYRNIQAWRHGPVVVDVYHKLKQFGRSPVTLDLFCSDVLFSDKGTAVSEVDAFGEKHSDVYRLLKRVYDFFKGYTPIQLMMVTHKEGTPWSRCYKSNARYTHIPDSTIKEVYEKIVLKEDG